MKSNKYFIKSRFDLTLFLYKYFQKELLSFDYYVDKIVSFFLPPTYLNEDIFNPERGQK